MSSSPLTSQLSPVVSPTRLRAIRGHTATHLAEAEAAELEAHSELKVTVLDVPRTIDEVGTCTVVQVCTADRPGLLASLSTVLAGVDLSIARASLSVSDKGVVFNEFWVQQRSAGGLGPVLEGIKRRAIEQRLYQWSAGQRLENALKPAANGASSDLGDLKQVAGWSETTSLPSHGTDGADAVHCARLVKALSAALTILRSSLTHPWTRLKESVSVMSNTSSAASASR